MFLTSPLRSNAHAKLQEVCIVFGDSILRACRSSKIDARSYNAFAAPSFGTIGQIGTELSLIPQPAHDPGAAFVLKDQLDAACSRSPPRRGRRWSLSNVRRGRGLRAVLIRGFGVGNVPIGGLSDLRPLLAGTSGNNLELVISSRCYPGHTDLSMYLAVAPVAERHQRDMTFEAAITKTMWALAQPEKTLREWFDPNLARSAWVSSASAACHAFDHEANGDDHDLTMTGPLGGLPAIRRHRASGLGRHGVRPGQRLKSNRRRAVACPPPARPAPAA